MTPGGEATPAGRYLARVPKVELHVHLEGAIRPARLIRILRRHGLHPELRHEQDLSWLFAPAGFAEFLEHFRFVVTCLRDPQDLHDVAHDLRDDLVRQNVVYAEPIFSAAIFARMGMPWDELFDAVTRGLEGAGLRWGLVVDLVRNFGAGYALEQIEAIAALGCSDVRGVHLGGDEVGFPAGDFGPAFAAARAQAWGLAAHAGEASGPASIRAAVDVLGVQRIGHGIRCIEDAALVRDLAARRVTLEVCPTSNVRTRVVGSYGEHPLPHLVRAGVAVTLGSDDPAYFDTDLQREMQRVHERLGIDLDTLDGFMRQGARAAFQPVAVRESLEARLRAEAAALRDELGLPADRGASGAGPPSEPAESE